MVAARPRLAGLTSAFLEPDPAVEWDTGRIAAVRQALAALSVPEDTEQL